ncbi:tsukushin isoform X1 [Zalophus californianus]|uniref:Tsukushi n=2 Tax=Zalophus californianus TaxID=9704 RepID=A0A6J2BYR1_ZALCA|nr:tsukushin isoform X1 [Zalophus californianus]XP_027436983.2 tsukushin isoform X1 [Zalophus californianus]XP_027436984.2 tsukushin isoform X1 [Zalophus californianus]
MPDTSSCSIRSVPTPVLSSKDIQINRTPSLLTGQTAPTMPWPLLLPLLLLLAVSGAQTTRPCFPGCQCEVETFGLFDSFSLTRVDCSGLGPHIVPVPIPLDTAHLDLSSNRLETVNESVLAGPGYTTLAGLDLSHNLLTSLSPTAFSRLRYLESLDISHNGLAALPAESFTSSPLSDVNLSHNRLREVSVTTFTTHSQARALHLDLSHNLIHRLAPHPVGAGLPTPTIQSLNLAWNQLRAVPDLRDLPLRYLSLDGNPLAAVGPGAFQGLAGLTHLSLGSLQGLPQLAPHGFRELQSLQVLDLSGNPKLKWAGAEVFSGLGSLQELDLSGTGLVPLPEMLLLHLPALQSISVGQAVRCRRLVREGTYPRQPGSSPKVALHCVDTRESAAKGPDTL